MRKKYEDNKYDLSSRGPCPGPWGQVLLLVLVLGVRSLSLGVRSLSLSWSLGVRSLSVSWSLGVESLSLSWSLGVRCLSWSLGIRSLLTSLVYLLVKPKNLNLFFKNLRFLPVLVTRLIYIYK